MFKDFISKAAAIFLIVLFVSPDLIASVKGLQYMAYGIGSDDHHPIYPPIVDLAKRPAPSKPEVRKEKVVLGTSGLAPAGKKVVAPAPIVGMKITNSEHFSILDELAEADIYALRERDMAMIAHTIKNVTRGAQGYGIRNSTSEIHKVSIGIHPQKLLSASRLNEVMIFYYDREHQSWQVAPILNIDQEKLNIEANVPGNTDYFGGLITAPDMPEANAYLPTAVTGLEAASPATGMNLMSPPDISHTGEAGLSYPLELPPGRQGLTPSLALSYSSDAGTGWLGMGWSLSVPCVSIDTRWGVPTFPAEQEEIYTLNGKSLTMEGGYKGNRSATAASRLSGDIRFFEPTASSYKEIVRKGDDPTTYTWVEIMANQTKYYYGTTDGETKDENYVIQDASGNVVKWYLARIVDKWGNEIKYNYNKVDYTSSGNGLKKNGADMVLGSIDYTLSTHDPNLKNYSVVFVSSNDRPDASVSLNTGVKIVDDHRLNSIRVDYDGTEVKRFDLVYGTGDFSKTQLLALKEYRHGNYFYQHEFEYYSKALTFVKQGDISVKNEGTFFDDIPDVLYSISGKLGDLAYSSPITTTQTLGWGAGGAIGIGVGPGPTAKFDKTFTFSMNFDYSESYSRNKVSMSDMNGDGLPDVIYDRNSSKKGYYPLEKKSDGTLGYGAFRKINYGGRLMQSSSQSFNYGFGFTIGMPYSFNMTWTNSSSKTKIYTTDYNADGFPDLVVPKSGSSVVQFGSVNTLGEYSFSSSSQFTPNPVYKNADISNDDDSNDEKDMEIVRTWEAPFSGTVDITGPATIPDDLGGEVYAAIQKDGSFERNFTRIMPGSPDAMSISGLSVTKGELLMFRLAADVDGQQDLVIWNPEVEYTSITETGGTDPGFGVDPNGLDYSESTYEDGFLLSGGNSVFVASDDNIKLLPNITVGQAPTDDLIFRVRAIIYDESQTNPTPTEKVWESMVSAGSTGRSAFKDDQGSTPAFLAGSYGTIPGLTTDEYAYLIFEISSTSNVKWKAMEWYPGLEYQGANCELVKTEQPIAIYHTFNKLKQFRLPVDYASAGYVSSDQLSLEIDVNSSLDVTDIFSTEEMTPTASNPAVKLIYATAKHNGKLLAKIPVEVKRVVSGGGYSNSIAISSTIPYDADFYWSEVNGSTKEIYFEFFSLDVNSDENLTSFFSNNNIRLGLRKNASTISYTSDYSIYNKEVGNLGDHYLHWGQFAWSDINNDDSEITRAQLVLSQQGYADNNDLDEVSDYSALENQMENDASLELENQEFFPLIPVRGDVSEAGLRTYIPDYNSDYNVLTGSSLTKERSLDRYSVFAGYIAAYAAGGTCAPGRLGELEELDDDVTGVQTPGSYGAYAVEQRGKSKQLAMTNGTSFKVGGSKVSLLNSTSLGSSSKYYSYQKSMFMDVNGDSYPDILKESSSYTATLTQPTGGFRGGTTGLNSSKLSKQVSFQTGAVASGSHINEDKRFTAGAKASISLGSTDTKYEFIDINGDGMPDGLSEGSGGQINISLNKGGSLLSGINHSYSNGSGLTSNTSFSNSVGVSGSRTGMKPSSNSKIQGSIEGGVSLNNPGSRSKRLFVDLNGDGLVDLIEVSGNPSGGLYASQNANVYINTGTDFVNYSNTINGADAFNKSEAHGFGAHIGGTIGIPLFTFLLAHIKLSISLSLQANFAINEISSRLVDMNGDGMVDYVHALDNGKLDIYLSEAGLSNKLKKVTNPLGGHFTIQYKLEGSKYGYKPTQVYTHVNSATAGNEIDASKEDMLWDMPFSKWVMSELEVNDGYALPNDIDGVEKSVVYFSYDGGIKDRREREFYGFSRLEKKYLPSNASNYTDYDPVKNNNIIHYVREVTEYEYPTDDDLDYRRKFYYLRNIVKHKYTYLHELVKTQIDGPNGIETAYYHYFYPMNVKNYDYEYRVVDLHTDLGKAIEIGSDPDPSLRTWEVVNWSAIGEAGSIFPALVETTEQNYPQVAGGIHKNKVLPRKFKIFYDKYFNVIRYADEGLTSTPNIQKTLVGTITYDYYDYHTQSNYFSYEGAGTIDVDEYENPVQWPLVGLVQVSNPYTGQEGYVFQSSAAGYLPDTVYFDRPGPCSGSNIFDPAGVYITIHRSEGVKTRTINVYEDVDNSVYAGAVIADMEYFSPVNAAQQTNMLEDHKIYLGSTTPANLARHTEVSALTQSNKAQGTIKNHLNSSSFAQTDLVYSSYGNVTRVTKPVNHKGQRMQVDILYDSSLKQYVEEVQNSYGDKALFKHDLKTGNLLGQISINGQQTQMEYDDVDRLKAYWAPREIGIPGSAPTITYEYHPEGIGTGANPDLEETIPVAFTHHNMARQERSLYPVTTLNIANLTNLSSRPAIISNPLNIATFTDGLGEAIQVKRDSRSDGSTKRLVSGMTKLDQLRRPVSTTVSILETIGTSTPLGRLNVSTASDHSQKDLKYDYDGRLTEGKVLSNNDTYTTTSTVYSWTASLEYYEESDGMTKSQSFIDARGRTYRQVELATTAPNTDIVTEFVFDALDQLKKVTDPKSLDTEYDYDRFGRKMYEIHPDRGRSDYTYDLANNLTSLETPATGSNSIDMEYHYNRLVKKTVPDNGELYNVTYKYGHYNDSFNGAGRIVRVIQGFLPGRELETDLYLWESILPKYMGTAPLMTNPIANTLEFTMHDYAYDELGNLVKDKMEIYLPTSGAHSYNTKHMYDSWKRTLKITYPDDEEVDYNYLTGTGELRSIISHLPSIASTYNGSTSRIITDQLEYDGFQNINYFEYGNGTESSFTYNPASKSLANVDVQAKDAVNGSMITMLNKDYTYDSWSRVDAVDNNNTDLPGSIGIGGDYNFDYTYDEFNRLKATTGSDNYDLQMFYNSDGSIKTRTQTLDAPFDQNIETGTTNFSYDASSHQLTNYSYNLSGSVTNDGTDDYIWNEEQQLMSVGTGGSGVAHYIYDHNGNRMLKAVIDKLTITIDGENVGTVLSGAPYILYVNPYYIVHSFTDSRKISKHYYMNSQRVASEVMEPVVSLLQAGPIGEPDPAEGDVVFSQTPLGKNLIYVLDELGEGEEADVDQIFDQSDIFDYYPPDLFEGIEVPEDETLEDDGSQNAATSRVYYNFATERIHQQILVSTLFWYHPDYLGHVEFVTDRFGRPYQYFRYTPYGEAIVAEKSGNFYRYNSRWRFNSKEFDAETGNYYYGARYFDPTNSVAWLSVDPLASEMPSWSPYNFTFGNPLSFIDPDGRAPGDAEGGCGKVIAVFYHGGPFGSGEKTTANEAGGAGVIYTATQQIASNSAREFKGTVIAPGLTSASGVKTGLQFIKDNYQEGDQVIIYGYSYGTDVAVDLTEKLKAADIDVDLLVTVDGSDGFMQNTTVNTNVPENVKTNLNVYQTDDSGSSSSSKSTGSSSSGTSSGSSGSSSSDSGTSNSPGSNGGPNTAVNPNKTNVINKDVTAEGVTHGNIQTKQRSLIQNTIQETIQVY